MVPGNDATTTLRAWEFTGALSKVVQPVSTIASIEIDNTPVRPNREFRIGLLLLGAFGFAADAALMLHKPDEPADNGEPYCGIEIELGNAEHHSARRFWI
jgi:hypothetical protein